MRADLLMAVMRMTEIAPQPIDDHALFGTVADHASRIMRRQYIEERKQLEWIDHGGEA